MGATVVAVDLCVGEHSWEQCTPRFSRGPNPFPYTNRTGQMQERYVCQECGVFGTGETREISL